MSDDTFKAPSTFESVLLAELNLGLPPLFFYELIREPNDWSYVLKLHAMFESALNRVLEKRGPEDDYDQPSTYYRKVEKAFQSGAVVEDEHYRNFLVSLNYLRNCFAHRASYIVADISSVINEMPARRRDIVVQSLAVGWGIPGGNQASPENRPYRRKWMSEHPRLVIHFSAGFALEMLSLAYYFRLGKDGKFYGDEFRRRKTSSTRNWRRLKTFSSRSTASPFWQFDASRKWRAAAVWRETLDVIDRAAKRVQSLAAKHSGVHPSLDRILEIRHAASEMPALYA